MYKFIGSGKFQLDKPAGFHILKVFLWTIASAAIVLLLDLIKVINVPPEYIWAVPIVNTILVAIQQFITDNSKYGNSRDCPSYDIA